MLPRQQDLFHIDTSPSKVPNIVCAEAVMCSSRMDWLPIAKIKISTRLPAAEVDPTRSFVDRSGVANGGISIG